MKILGLEFSSAQRAVAVCDTEGAMEAAGVVELERRGGGCLALVEEVLRQAGWDREMVERIAVGLGPGSYTGIRIALALAQGWQLGAEVEVVGCSSLELIAQTLWSGGTRGRVAAVVDAQRGEVNVQGFELTEGGCTAVGGIELVPVDALKRLAETFDELAGPEMERWPGLGRTVYPDCRELVRKALQLAVVPGERLEPIYVRPLDFVKSGGSIARAAKEG